LWKKPLRCRPNAGCSDYRGIACPVAFHLRILRRLPRRFEGKNHRSDAFDCQAFVMAKSAPEADVSLIVG
jgi:hypothetical protein